LRPASTVAIGTDMRPALILQGSVVASQNTGEDRDKADDQ
jgi:hypothetical protein